MSVWDRKFFLARNCNWNDEVLRTKIWSFDFFKCFKKFWKKISFYKRIWVKLKFEDFTQTTLEKTTSWASKQNFLQILNQAWKRRENRKIRLVWITIHFPEQKNVLQLKLWEDDF